MKSEYINNKSFEAIIINFQKCKREKCKYDLILKDLCESHQRKLLKNLNCFDLSCMLESYKKKHEESCKSFEKHKEQLAFAFYTLSENIVRYAKFNFDDDDAIQEGVLICFEKIDRFDPSKGKAFNYMTTCILNHFRQMYRSARNYNDLIKNKYFIHVQEVMDQTFNWNGKDRRKHIDNDSGGDII